MVITGQIFNLTGNQWREACSAGEPLLCVYVKRFAQGRRRVSSKVGLLEGFLVGRALVAPLWQTNLKAPNRASRESGVRSLAGFKLVPGVGLRVLEILED